MSLIYGEYLVNVHFSDIPHTFIPHFTLHSAEKIRIKFSANYLLITFRNPHSAKYPFTVAACNRNRVPLAVTGCWVSCNQLASAFSTRHSHWVRGDHTPVAPVSVWTMQCTGHTDRAGCIQCTWLYYTSSKGPSNCLNLMNSMHRPHRLSQQTCIGHWTAQTATGKGYGG